ncbi:hypothetical protein LTR53_012100 [Teratosphaeriaceae sp. CCFEE 6253]|nr:hypothetical protein LTR53_012100 [Teratosphaeriaceae sp. CCFEE 6253]
MSPRERSIFPRRPNPLLPHRRLLSITLANQVIADAALVCSLKGVVAMVPAVVHFDNFPAKFQPMYKLPTENARDAPVIDVESTAIFFHAAGVSPADASAFTALAPTTRSFRPSTSRHASSTRCAMMRT